MSPSKVQAHEIEKTPAMNDNFDSGHLQHEREKPDMERKYMNSDKAQWKEPELTALLGNVGGGTNKQGKNAHIVQCKS